MSSVLPTYLDSEWALSQIGDLETMNSMLLMLQESLARDLPLISACLQCGDVPGANRILHSLKGFIPIFCQNPLSAHVEQVEFLSKSGSIADVSSAFSGLKPELEKLLQEVGAYVLANTS